METTRNKDDIVISIDDKVILYKDEDTDTGKTHFYIANIEGEHIAEITKNQHNNCFGVETYLNIDYLTELKEEFGIE